MTRFDDHITGHLPQMGYDRALNIPCLKLFENHFLFDHLGATFQCKLL